MMIATAGQRPTRPLPWRRPLILAAVLAGAVLQHALVSLPLEPAPVSPQPPAPAPRASSVQPVAVAWTRAAKTIAPHLAAARVPVADVKGVHLQAPVPAPAAAVAPTDSALSASIGRAFNAYALPYQAERALIVAVGRQFGLDPAVPAALFMHEDGDINNRALFPQHMNWLLYHTRNPGNIKCMYDPCYDGFQVYPTYRAGILDWFRLYDHYYYDLGIHDLGSFVATYCPPNVDGNGPPTVYQSDVMVKAARIRAGW
jgi:hypothetical protein